VGKPPTAEEQAEIKRLLEPTYFIESCLYIVNKQSKKVPYILNAAQKLYMLGRTCKDIILKARKMGFSTLLMALYLHACVFRENTYAVLVSHDKESTKRLFERLKYMIRNSVYPIKTLPADIENFKGGEIRFPETNSKFWIGTAGSKSFGRGDDITHAHLSEPAFYEDQSVMTAIGEALVDNAYLALESTANGAGTPYHEFWQKAEQKLNDFKPHFYAWFTDPHYEIDSPTFELDDYEKKLRNLFNLSFKKLAWRRKKMRDMVDPKLFPQEYPATPEEAFLTSGRMVFDWEAIQHQEADARRWKWRGNLRDTGGDTRIEPNDEGPFVVWRTTDDRVDYLITADSSEGIPGLDYSVLDVWDTRTWEQVAQWRGYTEPDKFADLLYMVGQMYRWAVVACEINYPGNAVVMRLREKQYPNLWVDQAGRGEPGFRTTEKSKAIIVTDAREAVRDLDIRVNSRYTLSELKTFCLQENGKMEAQKGCHDDTVMTLAIAAFILKRWTLEPEMRKRSYVDRVRRGRRPRSGSRTPRSSTIV